MAMPTNPADAIHDACSLVSDHSDTSAAMMKEIRPTSMASSAQPRPEPPRMRMCPRVNGCASRRAATEGVETSVMP